MARETRFWHLTTRWNDEVSHDCPLSEYPRPQFMRPGWLCLNGMWSYGVFPEDQTPERLTEKILVPFSPETALSGASRGPKANERAWYSRRFRLPAGFMKDRLLLNFGAVDQLCEIFINGRSAGYHEGGYTPFTLDITPLVDVNGENTVTVAVSDRTANGAAAYGKQSETPGTIWYTAQSGIWQTVWLESVPEKYISSIRITPVPEKRKVVLQLPDACEGDMFAILAEGKKLHVGHFDADGHAEVTLENCVLWSPEQPFLYDLILKRGRDLIKCYFAMRSIKAENGRLYLNGEPIFLTGLLDQGYWPESLYTPPTDAAMIFDIETAKGMGFNVLRKHMKVEPLRWYYHCDRLGMLVWQDFPNGGNPYSFLWTAALPSFLGLQLSDAKAARFGRREERGRRQFLREAEDIVSTLYNSPSVICWTLFHEGWGQFGADALTKTVRRWDGTRLIDQASGWHDQHGGDFCSRHTYFLKPRVRRDKRVQALTEFGGYNLKVAGHTYTAKEMGYKKMKNRTELAVELEKLYRSQILPLKAKGLCACIYTQLTDVESEMNGLLTWDRDIVKVDAARMQALNALLKAPVSPERSK